jgi:hypothetical protein
VTPKGASTDNTDEMALMILPDNPVSFGYKCIWIAVRTNDKDKVAHMLGIKNKMACNWKYGIEKAYERKVFISPSVGQWTFAIGWGLADFTPKSELEETIGLKAKIDALSKEFGEAQIFATHRVSDAHSWAKSINGQTVRYYAWAGESVLIEGEPTTIEIELNLANTFLEEAQDENYYEQANILSPMRKL